MYVILYYLIILYNYYLFITIIYNETYHVNKGVIISISNITSTITLALPKSDNNNNNNNNNNIYIYIYVCVFVYLCVCLLRHFIINTNY